jgi:hypothetical protein
LKRRETYERFAKIMWFKFSRNALNPIAIAHVTKNGFGRLKHDTSNKTACQTRKDHRLFSALPHILLSRSTRRKMALTVTAVLSIAIFVLALIPMEFASPVPGTDKLHHLIAFGALTLPCAALCPRTLVWVLPAIILQAGLIELVQPYVNRLGEWADFIADLKGVAFGLGLGLILWSVGVLTSRRRQRGLVPKP